MLSEIVTSIFKQSAARRARVKLTRPIFVRNTEGVSVAGEPGEEHDVELSEGQLLAADGSVEFLGEIVGDALVPPKAKAEMPRPPTVERTTLTRPTKTLLRFAELEREIAVNDAEISWWRRNLRRARGIPANFGEHGGALIQAHDSPPDEAALRAEAYFRRGLDEARERRKRLALDQERGRIALALGDEFAALVERLNTKRSDLAALGREIFGVRVEVLDLTPEGVDQLFRKSAAFVRYAREPISAAPEMRFAGDKSRPQRVYFDGTEPQATDHWTRLSDAEAEADRLLVAAQKELAAVRRTAELRDAA